MSESAAADDEMEPYRATFAGSTGACESAGPSVGLFVGPPSVRLLPLPLLMLHSTGAA